MVYRTSRKDGSSHQRGLDSICCCRGTLLVELVKTGLIKNKGSNKDKGPHPAKC